MVCRDCLGRTPFATLVAAILCCLGVALFCGTLYRAIEITLTGIFNKLFGFDVPWLESIQVGFIIFAVMMGLFALLLLVFAFLATGATRQNIYSGAKCIMGGRVAAGFFLGITYILNVFWMCVTSVCVLPILVYAMLASICMEEIENKEEWYYEGYCFNLSRFGIYKNATENLIKNALCDLQDLSDLCQYTHDAGPLYGVAFAASLLVVLAMVLFLVALSASYSRIQITKELGEYKQAIALGDQSSNYM